jgi:glutaredoxin
VKQSLALVLLLSACGNPVGEDGAAGAKGGAEASAPSGRGEVVTPPFEVRGELEGLLLVWFDERGTHSAARRSEVPEARRSIVRVDSLAVAPERRLDPEHVYVADLSREAGAGYPVRRQPRAWFEAQVEAARPRAEAAQGSGDVTLYSASWCGACRSAAAFLRSRNVPFVEKDIEKDPAANDEMLRKARAAGKTPRGVPVIDFRGNILLGFDRGALERLIGSLKGAR